MLNIRKFISALTLAMVITMTFPAPAIANENGTESGDDAAIVLDLVVLRPTGLLATAAGFLIFVGSLPISIPTLSVGKAFNALVVSPAHYTFVRELGSER